MDVKYFIVSHKCTFKANCLESLVVLSNIVNTMKKVELKTVPMQTCLDSFWKQSNIKHSRDSCQLLFVSGLNRISWPAQQHV